MKRSYRFRDELNDDFAGTSFDKRPLGNDYDYLPDGKVYGACSFVLYRMFATPVTWVFNKVAYHERIVGRKALREARGKGCFVYGNHTRSAGDAFTPSHVCFPKRTRIIVNDDAVSVPVLSTAVKMLGGLPVPDSLTTAKNFMGAVRTCAEDGNAVFIYPEAHIWPYYTQIRNFRDASFSYPVDTGLPAYAVTTTYKKRALTGLVRTTVYVDGPFYPDMTLDKASARKKLRDQVYSAMVRRSAESDYSYHEYIDETDKEA